MSGQNSAKVQTDKVALNSKPHKKKTNILQKKKLKEVKKVS